MPKKEKCFNKDQSEQRCKASKGIYGFKKLDTRFKIFLFMFCIMRSLLPHIYFRLTLPFLCWRDTFSPSMWPTPQTHPKFPTFFPNQKTSGSVLRDNSIFVSNNKEHQSNLIMEVTLAHRRHSFNHHYHQKRRSKKDITQKRPLSSSQRIKVAFSKAKIESPKGAKTETFFGINVKNVLNQKRKDPKSALRLASGFF